MLIPELAKRFYQKGSGRKVSIPEPAKGFDQKVFSRKDSILELAKRFIKKIPVLVETLRFPSWKNLLEKRCS